MKTTLTIALLQLVPGNSAAENLAIGLAACRRAKERGADLALFPEMWSNGYRIYNRPVADWQAEALPVDGEFVAAFGRLAAELEMAIGVTLLEAWPGGPRNTLVLFDRRGERKLTYAKVHTCDFDVERNLTPGDGFFVTELDTAACAGGGDDLLRPRISRKRPHPDAAGRRADPDPERLPDGAQPAGPAARPGV